MTSCDTTNFMYPMKADIYFPILAQGDYGQPKKDWVYDRTIICNATPVGGAGTEDIKPESFLQYENKLIARVSSDPRLSSNNSYNAITNILITNIRNANDSDWMSCRAAHSSIYRRYACKSKSFDGF